MTSAKNNFIQSLFKTLQTEEYALLKWLRMDLSQLADTSDLDILVSSKVAQKIDLFVQTTNGITKVEKQQLAGVTHYYLYFSNGDFLQIDLLFKFVRKGLVYLSTKEVFNNLIVIKGIKTYTTALLFEHVLLFNCLNKGGLPLKYQQFFKELPTSEQNAILDTFNTKYGTNYKHLTTVTLFNPINRRIIIGHLNSLSENSIFNKIINCLTYGWSVWQQLKGENGRIITFSGVDGAGKSTIINDTLCLLGGKYRKKVIVLRHRPSLLPIISAWKYGKQKAEQKSVERLPRQGNNNNKISSFLRFSYYYLDYLLGQFYIRAKYLSRGYTVLYDRYYFDFIIDGKRSNINLSPTLPKFLYTFIAKPDLNFFLYADAHTIVKRKQELSISVINQLTKKYLLLFQDLATRHQGLYINIENIDRQDTLKTVLNHYLKIA